MVMPEPMVLDTTVLDELCASIGDDRGFVVDLAETYLGDGAVQVEAITVALAGGDSVRAVRPAHTLKSSSATVGAMRLAATARRIEAATREGAAPAAEDVASLDGELRAVTEALRGWIDSGITG